MCAVACLASGACRTHVVVPDAPPQSTAPEVRRFFYEAHGPLPIEREDVRLHRAPLADRPTVDVAQVRLRSGEHVTMVEDLRPLVDEGSPTADAIDEALDARARADVVSGVGIGLLGLGFGAATVLLAVHTGLLPLSPDQGPGPIGDTEDVPPFVIGALAASGGGLVLGSAGIAWGLVDRQREDAATTQAFRGFDADLRAHLALQASTHDGE
jgi:hypothetical protein